MITRGHFIGQIIDELTAVSNQVEGRAGLQLYDLNRYLEDFFKEILNIVYGYSLVNLNEERSNNPGLDLGDESAKVAFQVTSSKSSSKINKTLEHAAGQLGKFPTIYVLVLVDKQSSYTGIKKELAKPFAFKSNKHILDTGDILKTVLSLPIDRLQRLHELVGREVARVKIELEVPDKAGHYQTNIDAYIEQIPRERFNGVSKYYTYLKKEGGESFTLMESDIDSDFKKLIKALKRLPRITRQFYGFLIDRCDVDGTNFTINADKLKRICTLPDMAGELRLLQERRLCWFNESDDFETSATWGVGTVRNANSEEFTWELVNFMRTRGISFEKVLVSLDFVDFS